MVSDEKATLENVRKAYDELQAAGITPSAARILEKTGGSKSTVLGHLATIRAETATPAFASDGNGVFLEKLAGQLAQKLWGAAQEQARHQYETQIRRLSALCSELMSEVEELRSAEEASSARAVTAEKRLERVQAELDSQSSTAARLEHIATAVNALTARSEHGDQRPTTPTMQAMLEVLHAANEPVPKDQLYATLIGTGHDRSDVQKARFHAIKSGYIQPEDGDRIVLTTKGKAKATRGDRKTA